MFEEPSANITQFLRDTLINDKVKFIKEFAVSDEEYNFKFEPTTTDLPEEIQYQCPILNVAIFYNAMNSFKHLVQGGSKLTGTDSWLCGPAHMAARCGRIKMLSHELLETINFQAMDWRGRTPAHYAAEFDHLDCLRFLIETKGCNPNARDKFGMTPLHLACANGHIDIIEYLIQNNAEWTTDALNRSPLEVAVEKGQIEALRFFASRNQSAIINSETSGRSLAHVAAISGFEDEIEFLSTIQGFDFNKLDNFGMSPLHYAAEHGQSKVISVLLGNESVNRNILSGNGEHPLHTAARHGQTHAIDSLLSTNPVENNPLDSRRNTPLHIAAMNGRIDSVQILLDGGGSKSAINADAMTPTDVAHGTYARNIQEALDGKLQNIMYLCEPDPYPQKKPQPQQEPPKPQQDSGCVVQ